MKNVLKVKAVDDGWYLTCKHCQQLLLFPKSPEKGKIVKCPICKGLMEIASIRQAISGRYLLASTQAYNKVCSFS
jgi:hypothetical protein